MGSDYILIVFILFYYVIQLVVAKVWIDTMRILVLCLLQTTAGLGITKTDGGRQSDSTAGRCMMCIHLQHNSLDT